MATRLTMGLDSHLKCYTGDLKWDPASLSDTYPGTIWDLSEGVKGTILAASMYQWTTIQRMVKHPSDWDVNMC